ncbi:Imm8 family immunity protein [Isoptericola sp. NPDC019693]|uniref:Imm8 family immunity protein n=1 Tax=Isoptericola sp. NPDC019693 TaxID=3364009 RepID=UPI00379EF497
MSTTGGTSGETAEVKQFLYHWGNRMEPDLATGHFAVMAQVLIGTTSSDLADSFDCVVCSPSWFAEWYSAERWDGDDIAEDVLPGGNVLPVTGVWLMRYWSSAAFEAGVHRLVSACSPAPDWGELANRIGRVLPWEYDYRHDGTVNQKAGLPRPDLSFWHGD